MNLPRAVGRAVDWTRLAAAALLFLAPAYSSGQDSVSDIPSFRTGCQALADGRYSSAADSFLESWRVLLESEAGEAEKDLVAARLLESLVRDRRIAEASTWIDQYSPAQPSRATLTWTARAFQESGRYADAAAAYEELASRQAPVSRSTTIDRVTCLTLSGNEEAALALLLGSALTPETTTERLRFAQIAARAEDFDAALRFLGPPTAPDPGAPLRHDTLLAVVSLRHWLTDRSVSETATAEEDFFAEVVALIASSRSSLEAHRSFLLLEEITGGAPPTKLLDRIESIVAEETHPASEVSAFFLPLLRAGHGGAEPVLEEFLASGLADPLAEEARLRLDPEGVEPDPPGRALSEFPGGKDRIRFEKASIAYRNGNLDEALRGFDELAKTASGDSRERALANSAIAAIQTGEDAIFEERFRSLEREFPESETTSRLRFLAGLRLAERGAPEAVVLLEEFVQQNTGTSAETEAKLALAELHLNQVPARPQEAEEILAELRSAPLTLAQNERLDYDTVWLESISGDSTGLISTGEAFLRDWPNSPYFADIALLVARQHVRANRPDEARELYDEVTAKFADSAQAEQARFFAAKTSPLGPDSIERFEAIARSEGEFAAAARHELALQLLALDRHEESRSTLSALVESEPKSSSLRSIAMADLAFTYYAEALAKGKDGALLETASDKFAMLARDASLPETIRYEAAVRRGRCLEALEKPEVALEIYESLVLGTGGSDFAASGEDPKTTEWIYRAGFAGVEILRGQKEWKRAVALADSLSRRKHPRAMEAARLSERMRLEHWIWE